MPSNIKILLLGIFIFSSSTVIASDWPAFTAPDVDYLLKHHLINTQDCTKGEGKLTNHANIPIKEFCLGRWCPAEWAWQIQSDNVCHDLKTEFKLQHYDITRHRGQDGTTEYSEVHALYADIKSAVKSAQLDFISPKNHWDCYEFSGASGSYISCANDI